MGIQFQKEVFEQLVLAEDKKELIQAVVRNAGSLHKGEDYDNDDDNFTDIDVVANKGAASVFLLYGPPGCGKTLTAESIAELLTTETGTKLIAYFFMMLSNQFFLCLSFVISRI